MRRKIRRPEAEKFGAIVRRHREKRGWTQAELAERAEISEAFVGFVERGDSVPTLTVILQITAAFGVRPMELLRDF